MTAAVYEERTPFVAAACLLALALRPLGFAGTAVTAGVGAAACVLPVDAARNAGRRAWTTVTLAGMALFALVRFGGHALPARTTVIGIAASAVAGIAEELCFRRLLYSRLERFGAAAAVIGAAAAFALVHIPGYGPAAAPVDVAARLVLGWQRWATGSWTAPAATHVFANLIAVA
jgi:membrane protease YdiL (CAAX protease family)